MLIKVAIIEDNVVIPAKAGIQISLSPLERGRVRGKKAI